MRLEVEVAQQCGVTVILMLTSNKDKSKVIHFL